MIIKLRSHRMGQKRIREQVFVGQDADYLQLAGELILEIGEWQTFRAALVFAAEHFTGWNLTVLTDTGTL
jgi:hypothetical protein